MSIRLNGAFLTSTSTITCSARRLGSLSTQLISNSTFNATNFLGITPQTTANFVMTDLGITYTKNTSYNINLPSGFFKDSNGNALASSSLSFVTPTLGPTYNSGNPTPGQTNFGNTSVVLSFNRQILRGTSGTLKLYNGSGLVVSINATDTTNITINDINCTVNLITYLRDNTNYYITIDSGFVQDNLGLPCEAVIANNVIYFTTGNNYTLGQAPGTLFYDEDTTEIISPAIQILDYTYSDSTGYTITITPSDVQGVLSMSSTGDATSSFNNTSKVLTLTGTRTQINTNLKNITLIPGGDIRINYTLTYRLTTPRSTVVSKTQTVQFGNTTQNTNCPSTYTAFNYMTTPLNIGQTYFYGGPLITDPDPTGAQFTVTLNSTNGGLFSTFAKSGGNVQSSTFILAPQNPISFTGTKAQINTIFGGITTQINYHGLPGGSRDTVVYTQTKSTDTSESTLTSINITFTLASNSPSVTGTVWGNYPIYRGSSITLTFDQLYYGISSIELVGGGGGGSYVPVLGTLSNPSYSPIGAGGGGGYLYQTNLSLTSQALSYGTNASPVLLGTTIVGAGGANGGGTSRPFGATGKNWSEGTNGGNTQLFGYIAYGGRGGGPAGIPTIPSSLYGSGASSASPYYGGDSGNGGLASNINIDNHFLWGQTILGGSGAGSTGPNVSPFTVGGNGISSQLMPGQIFGVGGYGCDGNTAGFFSRYTSNTPGANNTIGHGGTGNSGGLCSQGANPNDVGNGSDGIAVLKILFR